MLPSRPLPSWLPEDPGAIVDIASLPYLERQTVVVVPDREAARAREALRRAAERPPQPLAELVKQTDGRQTSDPLFGLALASAVQLGAISAPQAAALQTLAPLLLNQAARAYRAWRKAKTATLLISTTEQQQLRWPKGDPVRDQIYAGSPADPLTYYPLASFHDDIFFERASQLRRLLSRLGAKNVSARHVIEERRRGSGRSRGPIPQLHGRLNGGVEGERLRQLEEVFVRVMSESRPVDRERVTQGLAWVGKEPDWQELIEERFADRLRHDRIIFRNDTDFGLGGSVEAAIKALPSDVRVGGEFARHQSSVFEIEVEFGPL